MGQGQRRPPAVKPPEPPETVQPPSAGEGTTPPAEGPPDGEQAAPAYVAGDDLVYVRTATSGRHGLPVHPGGDVPADALPAHVEILENLGLVKRK